MHNNKTVNLITSHIKRAGKRYALDALSAMALGLFSSLIIGTILEQIGKFIPSLSFLIPFATMAKAPQVVGGTIGISIAWGLKVSPLAMFSSAISGALGYQMGGPLCCYLSALIGAELGNLITGKTKVDIIVVPCFTIIFGGLVAIFSSPIVNALMNALRAFIDTATTLQPIPMGIIVSVVVGLTLTAPISSAALCAMIFAVPDGATLGTGLELAAGAATAGCCAQMVGFACCSYKENKMSGLIAQGLGTSMLQVPNILMHPLILIPPTLAAAIVGPLSTTLFSMKNVGVFAGMGTSGLVGQIGTFQTMLQTESLWLVAFKVILLHIALPAIISIFSASYMKKKGWIGCNDMKLSL